MNTVNIWQSYKQERDCLVHFARLASHQTAVHVVFPANDRRLRDYDLAGPLDYHRDRKALSTARLRRSGLLSTVNDTDQCGDGADDADGVVTRYRAKSSQI